jgi:hypothetical protein
MNRFHKLAAGTSLAAMLVGAFPATAQVTPSNRSAPAQQSTPAPSPTPSSTDGMENASDFVFARGEVEEIDHRHAPPPAPRVMVQTDDITKMTRAAWLAHGWSNESFNAMRRADVGFCKKTVYFTQRFASLADRYRAAGPEIPILADRYDKMRRRIKTAGVFRTIGNIAAPVLAFTGVGAVYGGMVLATSIGGEAQGRAGTKQQLLANDAGQLNNELTGYHIEFNLLSLELYADYIDFAGSLCTDSRTVQNFGAAFSSGDAQPQQTQVSYQGQPQQSNSQPQMYYQGQWQQPRRPAESIMPSQNNN